MGIATLCPAREKEQDVLQTHWVCIMAGITQSDSVVPHSDDILVNGTSCTLREKERCCMLCKSARDPQDQVLAPLFVF